MPSEVAARELIRWTARLSLLLLLCAALAGEGIGLPPWASRRGLPQGLAASHTLHAAGIASLAVLTNGRNLLERGAPVLVLGGGRAYAFIYWGARGGPRSAGSAARGIAQPGGCPTIA